MAGANESQEPDAPKEIAGSVSGDLVPLAEGSKDPEISPAQPSLEGIEDKSLALSWVFLFFYFFIFSKVLCCNGAFP